jgi:hypothetical protein
MDDLYFRVLLKNYMKSESNHDYYKYFDYVL